jgi:pilus assembly protein Flp/PilA
MQALKKIRRFLTAEEGTTAVEYAVLLAMILIAIIIGVTSAGGGVSNWWGNIKTKIESY